MRVRMGNLLGCPGRKHDLSNYQYKSLVFKVCFNDLSSPRLPNLWALKGSAIQAFFLYSLFSKILTPYNIPSSNNRGEPGGQVCCTCRTLHGGTFLARHRAVGVETYQVHRVCFFDLLNILMKFSSLKIMST